MAEKRKASGLGMIVVDTNILAYAFIEGAYTRQARDFLASVNDWIIPEVFEREMTNILVSYARFKGFSVADCQSILQDMLAFAKNRIVPVDYEKVLSFAARNEITAYDAEFLWLADTGKSICLTEDRELRKKFPKLAQSLQQFNSASK